MDSIRFSQEGGVASIIFNRPSVFNSFNEEMAKAFQQRLDECEADESVRCIVISGAGKAFCAGQDLQEAIDPEGPGITHIVQHHYNPIITRIRTIEKPIIAAVNGVAAGAGANIALACDIVLAKETASFIQAFSKIGLIPDSGGTFTLPRIIGLQRATALAMLGDKLSAKDAEQMGLIYKCIAEEEFESAINQLATKLANMPTKGLGLTKRAFNASLNNTLAQQLAVEKELQTAAADTYDYQEGVQAFLEKRKPTFKGK